MLEWVAVDRLLEVMVEDEVHSMDKSVPVSFM